MSITTNDEIETTLIRANKSFQQPDYSRFKMMDENSGYYQMNANFANQGSNIFQQQQQKFGLLISKHQPATKSLTNTSNPYCYNMNNINQQPTITNNFNSTTVSNISNNDLNMLSEFEKSNFLNSLKTLFAIFDTDCKVLIIIFQQQKKTNSKKDHSLS